MKFREVRVKQKLICTSNCDYGGLSIGTVIRVEEIPEQKNGLGYFRGSDGDFHYAMHFEPYKPKKEEQTEGEGEWDLKEGM